MENETKNTGLEKVEPTYTNLDFKPDTSIPDFEPEIKHEPGAKPGPGAEPGVEPEGEQEEPEEDQDKGDPEKGEEPEEDPIKVILKNYERLENPMKNLEVAKQFLQDNYRDAPLSTVIQVITFYMKEYFRLDKDGLALMKTFWADLQKEQKEAKKEETAKQKEAKKEETAKQKEAEQAAKAEAKKEAKKTAAVEEEEAMKKRQDEQREANQSIREKREKHIAALYDVLKNKSGKHTIEEIENAKTEIKNLMMPSFWDIEGMNVKTGNPGHLSLKKLPIADYINKAFNIVKFGGRNWWYDWGKAFYTYDSDDVYIQKEITDIMRAAGDGDFYKYNGNSIVDTGTITHLASTVNVYTDNPFNKHTGYINAKNGVLQIDYENRKVKLIGKKPEYMFSYCSTLLTGSENHLASFRFQNTFLLNV